jgi:hypothetical protein
MNDFSVAYIILQALLTQAEEALKVWDKRLCDDAKVGSLSQGGL